MNDAGNAGCLGRLRLHYGRLGSTNDLARALAAAGYPHGTVVTADEQTAGRGRQGRRWTAAPGSALLCSLLLRPSLPASSAPRLTMAAALATAEAITDLTGVKALLKWPNDVLLPIAPSSASLDARSPALAEPSDAARVPAPEWSAVRATVPGSLRKVAGLLLETTLSGATIEVAILGIGINVGAHPPDVVTATDLAQATGRHIDRAALLDSLLVRLIEHLALAHRDAAALQEAWRARLVSLGQSVRVTETAASYEAVAEAVDADGALLVRLADGSQRRLLAAEVTLSH